MTSPIALPAPVARLVRATAGRRALQLALLFGGLFVLGVVCGGRAQADGLSDAGSLDAGHVAVREHVADSAQKLREAGSHVAPAHSGTADGTEGAEDTGASNGSDESDESDGSTAASASASAHERAKARAVEHAPAPDSGPAQAKPTEPTPAPAQGREAAPAAAPAPAASAAPAPVRPAEPTPNPVDAKHAHAPGAEHAHSAKLAHSAKHAHGVKRLARSLHDKSAAPGDPTTATSASTSTSTSISTFTPTAPVPAYLADSLRQRIVALGGDQARLRSAADALRYLTAPVGAAVRQVTGPVEELATRAVAELVGAVPEQLTHGRLGGIIAIVDPTDDARPEPPAATAPQQSDAPAAHGDRSAPAADRAHDAVSGPQAYDVAQFGDVEKTETGARAEARPASPVVPQRPDGVPSAGASAGDGGSSRHGDLHAAAFGGRTPVLLASGATASAGTSPVVDRLRDIPEFPG